MAEDHDWLPSSVGAWTNLEGRKEGRGYGYRHGDVLESEAGLPQLHNLLESSQTHSQWCNMSERFPIYLRET